jgi:sugar phosphate isomerase/epimerase
VNDSPPVFDQTIHAISEAFIRMQQLSMNEITTFRWSLDEDLRNYQSTGYQAIGLWLQKLCDYGEDAAIDLLAESSLRVSNTVWAGGFTGSDGRTLNESIMDTVRALRQSAAVRSGCLVLYAGGRNNHTFRHAERLLRMALDELVAVAEIVEVPLALEPVHPACSGEWTFLTDLTKTLRLVEQYDSPYLKMAFDTYHFPLGQSQHDLIAELVPHLAVVHLGDRRGAPNSELDRCLLGAGRVPLGETVSALLDAGYEGDFDVKLIGQEIEATDYWTVLHESRVAVELLAAVYTRVG